MVSLDATHPDIDFYQHNKKTQIIEHNNRVSAAAARVFIKTHTTYYLKKLKIFSKAS